jgi:predicted porin
MKKSLIAMAVLAASGVASAQSSVTLYGLADVWFGSVKVKTSAPGVPSTSLRQTKIDSGGFNTSRFGLKGSEDLGGGLKANFLLEAGYDISTGAANNYTNPFTGATSNAIFGRQSWVGLSGGFGEVKLGKMWTPYDEVKGIGAGAFDSNAFAPANAAWLSSSAYQDRPGNSIYYSTPNISGFSAALSYSFGENKTNAVAGPPAVAAADAGRIVSGNVQYANGPLAVALSHQQEKANGNATTGKFTQLNGSWDFRVVKLLSAYGQTKNVSNGTVVTDKSREFQLGVDVPLGSALTLSGGVARSKTTLLLGAGESKGTAVGIAAKYDLSKRTFLYTGLQLAKNELANNAGETKTDVFAVGVQHKF